MRSLKKRGPHVLDDLNDLLFSLHLYKCFLNVCHGCDFSDATAEQLAKLHAILQLAK